MPFVQRSVEPRFLSRTSLFEDDGTARVRDYELEAVTNNTLSNALRQLASVVLVANDIFADLGGQLQAIARRARDLQAKIQTVDEKVSAYDPKKVTVPESDICSFANLKEHYAAKHDFATGLFTADSRPTALQLLYETATKTPIHLMRQMDRWRRDGHRSSRFFMCTPVLGERRRKIRNRVDIDIETCMPDSVKELRRWTSTEALGDITVAPDCPNRIAPNATLIEGETTDGAVASDDEALDHKLPSPEEQVQVVALKFPAEIVAVDVSGRSFDRMSVQRRSLLHAGDVSAAAGEDSKKRMRTRRPRNRRRNTLAGTDQKEIQSALNGEEPCSSAINHETESTTIGAVSRSKSSDILRSSNKKDSPSSDKKSHFNTLKQWGKTRYDRLMNKSSEQKSETRRDKDDIDDFNIYETVTMKRRRSVEREKRMHERNPSISSSEKSSVNIPISSHLSSVMNIAVKLRESSAQRRLRRSGGGKDEPPHSSSGNWSASSESGRASIGSEFTTTTQQKSTTSTATSSNSLNQQAPNSVNSRRRFNVNTSTSSSVTSEGTLTPDIIHDLHGGDLDGETSSVYSCDTEGYYTSFHMDSGLKTLKEEEMPATPLHSTSAFSNSGSNCTVLTAENEYELFGRGSTSTTASSAGTVCTTLRASDSSKSLSGCPPPPERKSSLSKHVKDQGASPESSLERDNTGTVKRSPASSKAHVIADVHKSTDGDVSPDSGHNTSSSPIESISSPNGVRSGSEFEFSESSDMEGAERIERIRVKTTINSSRIPSMCVITPPHSDDDSVKSYNNNNPDIKKIIRVNPQSGYATFEAIQTKEPDLDVNKNGKIKRAPSPSGGTMIINESPMGKSPPSQPIIKASLLPLNNMFGRLKTNLANLAHRRDSSKSPNRPDQKNREDCGDYVTLADVRNNNEKAPLTTEFIYANAVVREKLETVSPKWPTTLEYVSLDELPCNENNPGSPSGGNTSDSLERKRRQGARVTLDAEGKVVYSSDSLRRRKGAHTTFEPGPFVKPEASPGQSPLPAHRAPKAVRPVANQDVNHPLAPQAGKLVIKAAPGAAEIVRVPPSTIVASGRPMSPPRSARGAYVHMQDTGSPHAQDSTERVPSPSKSHPVFETQQMYNPKEMYNYRGPADDDRKYWENQYYFQKGGNTMYQTLPSKKSHYFQTELNPERSVTPDITRGLERKPGGASSTIDRRTTKNPPVRYEQDVSALLHHKLGIPVKMPDLGSFKVQQRPHSASTPTRDQFAQSAFAQISPRKSADDNNDSFRISPIDPRHSGGFQSSTPSQRDLKSAANLESKLLSPKKSTMSNEELYAVIHKGKKKLNIDEDSDSNRASPVTVVTSPNRAQVKSPETGYIGDKSKSRLSWSPNKGEYVDFNSDIDRLSPPTDSRSRQSWACSDRKGKLPTSRLDFKKLLLQKSNVLIGNNAKKLSAVEQLKLSKQQLPNKTAPPPMSILELSGSPRSLVNRKLLATDVHNSPEKAKPPPPKLMSPRSQWRFANPRTDVLSSTILEDCREDESPSNSIEKRRQLFERNSHPQKTDSTKSAECIRPGEMPKYAANDNGKPYSSISQRLQAQRAEFFTTPSVQPPSPPSSYKSSQFETRPNEQCSTVPPTLETAF